MGAVVALTTVTSLLAAFMFVVGSADRQEPVVERFAGVPVVVVADLTDRGVPAEIVERLEARPEVAAAVSEVRFPATVLDDDRRRLVIPDTAHAHSWGLSWEGAALTPFRLAEGAPPRGDDEVVIDQHVARIGDLTVGDRVELTALGQVLAVRVVGIAEPGPQTDWRYQSAVFFDDARAAELAGTAPGRAHAVGLLPEVGIGVGDLREAAQQAVDGWPGGYSVVTGADRGEMEDNISVDRDRQVAAAHQEYVVSVAVVGVAMVAGALGLALRSRSREVALLRALGATPRQVAGMASGEAAALSVVALLIGLPVGVLLSQSVAGLDLGPQRGLSPAFELHYLVASVVRTAVLVFAAAQISALLAARHALRVRPADAFARAASEGRPLRRGRVIVGLVLLGGSVATAGIMSAGGADGDVGDTLALGLWLLAVAAVGVLAPWLMRGAALVLRRARRNSLSGAGGLAIANVAFFHRRYAGLIGPVALGLAFAGMAGAGQEYFNVANAERGYEQVAADYTVTATAAADRIGAAVRQDVEDLPQVAAVASHRIAPLLVRADDGSVLQTPRLDLLEGTTVAMVVFGDADRAVDDLGLLEGHFDPDDEGAVLVNEWFAQTHTLGVGATVELVDGDGEELGARRVAGIYDPFNGWLGQDLVLSSSAAGTLAARNIVGQELKIRVVNGAGGVREELERRFPSGAFAVRDRDELWQALREEHADQNRGGTITFLVIGVFVMAAGIANVATSQLDRVGEVASLRRLGMRWGQIRGMILAEAALTTAMVAVIGLLATWWVLALLLRQGGLRGVRLVVELTPFGRLAILAATALLLIMGGSLTAMRRLRPWGGGS
jgi:putative ABC transport system permease protein